MFLITLGLAKSATRDCLENHPLCHDILLPVHTLSAPVPGYPSGIGSMGLYGGQNAHMLIPYIKRASIET